jgi:hypothetical protein
MSTDNTERYDAYLTRAVFYGVTGRTLVGLNGQIFARDSNIDLPTELDVLETDLNGEGVSLEQSSKKACIQTLALGRGGLHVDYPETVEGATVKELEDGEIRPTIHLYKPQNITNWRTTTRGARVLLSLVVLREEYENSDDEFETKTETRYRVLKLEDNVYTVEIWEGGQGAYKKSKTMTPRDAKGQTFDEIPFFFMGSENNDSEIDEPPLFDMSDLNIAHYRNSADYEESVYMIGQPMYWFSMTDSWYKDVLKSKISVGARAALALPTDGGAGILQAEPNSLAKEAMDQKESQMIALGAKLVEKRTVTRTATETKLEEVSETSVLASIAENVAAAYQKALQAAARFVGTDGEIVFELNTDFDIAALSAQEQQQLIANWQAGAMSFNEVRAAFKTAGIAFEEDEKAKEEHEDALKRGDGLTGVLNDGE